MGLDGSSGQINIINKECIVYFFSVDLIICTPLTTDHHKLLFLLSVFILLRTLNTLQGKTEGS